MVRVIGSLFTLAGETLSAIGRMIERPAFNDEAAEQFLGGRWESDGPDAADVLADFEERVEVFEPPLIPRSSTAATPPRLVDRREPPATPSVVEAPGTQSSECPGCSDFACPGPHPTSPGASPVSQPAAAAVPGEAVGATESSSGGGADRPLSEVLIEVCDVLRGLTSTPLSMTAWLSYRNDALMLVPELEAAADKLRDE